ncbi:DUF6175 family protein [Flammeovirgaceae bacterium SG7u.111]|nr:DUF6175 family protein [Flammeovirgaceae bacterium SG7u.132]WPO36289.1 DUF6175 family protein [Flammeovirgaceae bacterium SG7u.111]
MRIFSPFVICLFLLCSDAMGQENQGVQFQYFSMMVLPYTVEGDRIEKKLEESPKLRHAITQIEDMYLSKGFQVYDFAARLEAYWDTEGLQESTGYDTKAGLLNFSKPDIYTELEFKAIDCGGGQKKARLSLKTYMTSSGKLLVNKSGDTNCFSGVGDEMILLERAVMDMEEEYTATLKRALDNMATMGQPVAYSITIDDNVSFDFNDNVKADIEGVEEEGALAEILSIWLDENVIFYKSTGSTSQLMKFDEVRLPLIDSKSKRVYNVEKFNRDFRRFIISKVKFADLPEETISAKVQRIGGVTVVHLTN